MDDMEKDAYEWGEMDTRSVLRYPGEPFPRRRHSPREGREAEWLRAYANGILAHLAEAEKFYTLRQSDVGKATITAFGKPWLVVNFMGRILPGDVGKRVYRVAMNDNSGHILQVENDQQRDRRLAKS